MVLCHCTCAAAPTGARGVRLGEISRREAEFRLRTVTEAGA